MRRIVGRERRPAIASGICLTRFGERSQFQPAPAVRRCDERFLMSASWTTEFSSARASRRPDRSSCNSAFSRVLWIHPALRCFRLAGSSSPSWAFGSAGAVWGSHDVRDPVHAVVAEDHWQTNATFAACEKSAAFRSKGMNSQRDTVLHLGKRLI